jgi:hypothetical protein
MSKLAPPECILPDGLYFKLNNQSDLELDDRLSLLFKEEIKQGAKEVEENAEKKHLCEIFEFDENVVLHENIPGINMAFLDQLFHQIKPQSTSTVNYSNEEDFVDIEQNEITAVTNHHTETDKHHHSFTHFFRRLIDDIHEEIDVIRGRIDEDTLVNRRRHKAKASIVSIDDNQTASF